MNVVVFGQAELVKYFQDHVGTLYGGGGIHPAYAVNPFSHSGNYPVPVISQSEAFDLYRQKKIDAYVFAMGRFNRMPVVRSMIRDLKLRGVKNIFVCNTQLNGLFLFRLDINKSFCSYVETNLIDACNLNCKACTHFASLFDREDIYPIEEFSRDMKQLSETVDILQLRLMGGEPLLLKNLDEYIDTARIYFPRSDLVIVSNCLLIPSADKKFFEALRRNSASIYISQYPPTIKIKNQIVEVLNREKVPYEFSGQIGIFRMTFSHNFQQSDANKAMNSCVSSTCRFLRNGKIYKCPTDALFYKYVEKFNLKGSIPSPMGADIYSKDLPSMLDSLDNAVDLCHLCTDKISSIPWQIDQNPRAENWMA